MSIDPTGCFSFLELFNVQLISNTLRGMTVQAFTKVAAQAVGRALLGALVGGLIGGGDSWLGDGKFLDGFVSGMKWGALMAAAAPILSFAGWLSVITFSTVFGTTLSVMEKKYAQAGFRLLTGLIFFKITHNAMLKANGAAAADAFAKENSITIGEIVGEQPVGAKIHLTDATPAEIASGMRPNSFWANLSDVAHMTVAEYCQTVMGPATSGTYGLPPRIAVVAPEVPGGFRFYQFSLGRKQGTNGMSIWQYDQWVVPEYVNGEPISLDALVYFSLYGNG